MLQGAYGAKVVSKINMSSATAYASVAAVSDRVYQLLGWAASSSDHALVAEVRFGADITGAIKISRRVGANTTTPSGNSLSEWYGDLGPIAGASEGIFLTTILQPASAGNATAELYYRSLF